MAINKSLREAADYALGTLEAIELYGVESLKPKVLARTIDKLVKALDTKRKGEPDGNKHV